MGELRYMISEAAKQVDVEAHVLRYWEEELDLTIDRTEMGHRYYTKEDIELFQCVKKLKEKGMQLKDLKPVIPDLLEKKSKLKRNSEVKEEKEPEDVKDEKTTEATKEKEELSVPKENTDVFTDEKLGQVRMFISDVVTEVVLDNNEKLKQEITESVTEEVSREMSGLLRAKEIREEEHFHKMDCLIRQQQALRKEAVKVTPIRRLRKMVMGT